MTIRYSAEHELQQALNVQSHTEPEIQRDNWDRAFIVQESRDPDFLATHIADADPMIQAALAQNPFTPKPVLAVLAASQHAHLRMWVASHPSLSKENQLMLASDPATSVRCSLVTNAVITAEILTLLAADPYGAVRLEARKRLSGLI